MRRKNTLIFVCPKCGSLEWGVAMMAPGPNANFKTCKRCGYTGIFLETTTDDIKNKIKQTKI